MILENPWLVADRGQSARRTVWGMDALQLHDQFWAAHGLQVVRTGDPPQISRAAAYLLLDPVSLVLFQYSPASHRSRWNQRTLSYIRLHDARKPRFRERVVTDEADKFVRFERHYDGGPFSTLVRVLLTRDPRLAAVWQTATEPSLGDSALRQVVPRRQRQIMSIHGQVYTPTSESEPEFITDLMRRWPRPDLALKRARHIQSDLVADIDAGVDASTHTIGPVWVGTGRSLEGDSVVIGPVVLWDDPTVRPLPQEPSFGSTVTAPVPRMSGQTRAPSRLYRFIKRGFDIIASLAALLLTLPLYPIILFAIWFEDGKPLFFFHRRETLGGRKFPCIKFRSMRRDAEKVKNLLALQNGIDGPQFFMDHDPRLTRTGAFLRKRQLDELPQFINVLLGHMSIVGPRPSPYSENQFCPPWRDQRLSVRPGITGLWQVKRTRQAGQSFQEWIRYDLEYVRSATMLLDLRIIFQTFMMFVCHQIGRTYHPPS